ncbi:MULTISPECIES: universal stress protein [Streptomyces]|uniref:UspA domain-containing protein n=1 Tax=Streptomyces virginiae TaxID=1961 RepID=A0ABQ3NL87_STRVG|nr:MULTISPECIES: universal stress protein [Streptomyces]KOU11840.1 universal stress protein [Streptomyces sp. WM6349]KOU92265.1 universal stress protein [Streptomyces sp. XY533]KOU93357.1 universal stress protein [Streptomyces sp. XY593]KOU96562.1 universal stress protein [Streptomyces sp. XY511]KOV52914.1 universal stress protein [Streptomyces sp. H036]
MSVVLGYDESPGAERALSVALEVATAFGEPLVLVYGAAAPGSTGEEYRAHREAVRQAGRSALAHAVEEADAAGVPSTVEVVDERPAQALLDAAERHGARVIIVGSWGDSPMRGALLGSTPHKLLHLSPVPVLCVPTESPPPR